MSVNPLRRHRGSNGGPADAARPPTSAELGAVPIGDAPERLRCRVVGEVTGMRSRPSTGLPSLAVTIADSTGSVVVVWTGRRAIGGITLGRSLLIDGVPTRRGKQLEFTNPAYTLLPPHRH